MEVKIDFSVKKTNLSVIQWYVYKYSVNIQYFVLPEIKLPYSNTTRCSLFPTRVSLLLQSSPRLALVTSTFAGHIWRDSTIIWIGHWMKE